MKGLERLTPRQRLQLLKFVSAAIWADLEVDESEKSFLLGLALKLRLPDNEVEHLRDWLERPPPPEEVDPMQIAPEHRAIFLQAVREAMAADNVIDGPERETLGLLEELLG